MRRAERPPADHRGHRPALPVRGTLWPCLLALPALLALCAEPAYAGDDDDQGDKQFVTHAPVVRPAPTGRLVLTVGALWERGNPPTQAGVVSSALNVASPDTLLWGDLRGVLDAQQAGGSPLDVRADFRLRLTPQDPWLGSLRNLSQQISTARGYQGGREYELREMWVGIPLDDATRLTLGRQILLDVDAITVDGARVTRRFAKTWQGEAFAGLFPNPFSRSLENDYLSTSELAFAGGADVSYSVPEVHGAAAVAAESFLGKDAGNGLLGGMPPTTNNLVTGVQDESPRVFLYWQNYWRPRLFLDVYSYLVLDVVSEAGPQLANGHLALNLRPTGSLRLEASYSRMSTYAAEIYLKHFLVRELDPGFNALLNNLLVMRMAQDEARLLVNATLGDGRFVLYWVGRYFRRTLLEQLDPRFANDRPDGFDLTVGARDLRSLAGLRLGLELTALYNYRSQVKVASVDAQREFADGAGIFDVQLAVQLASDDNFGKAGTTCDSTAVANYATCFGFTDSMAIDLGAMLGYRLRKEWFVLGDYHLIVNSAHTNDSSDPAVFTNLGFLRIQYRF